MTTAPSSLTHDQARELMLDGIREALASDARHGLDLHLEGCPSCREEYEELQAGWNMLGQLPDVHPPRALRAQTLSVLSAYAQGLRAAPRSTALDAFDHILRAVWPARPVWQAGIAVVLLLAGIAIGTLSSRSSADAEEVALLRGEIKAMSRLFAVSLLQQQSASERLKGVSMSARLDRSDDEITSALLEALKFDPNVNVRLAALDALSGQVSEDPVRAEILTWLPRQNSPLVQLAMIDMLAERRDPPTDQAFEKLMNTEKLNPAVKERVSMFVGDVR